jgi:hypothetical protein
MVMSLWLQKHGLTILAILLALGALASWPFVYYQVLDWTVAGAALLIAKRAHQQGQVWMQWLFIAVAVLFNPLAPLYIRQDLWRIADIIVAILFFLSFVVPEKKK